MNTLWWLFEKLLWLVWTVLSWFVSTFFWLSVWVLAPIAIVAFLAVRVAEYTIGKERVRLWVRQRSLKFGTAAWRRLHGVLFALGSLPLRVLVWLVLYTLWHSVISLLWTPEWKPWQRAWDRRWRKRRDA